MENKLGRRKDVIVPDLERRGREAHVRAMPVAGDDALVAMEIDRNALEASGPGGPNPRWHIVGETPPVQCISGTHD
ncbi:hypothetical protein E2562_013252 [Oryza meyeriana var. granulata]|uniref:Uncharacterized protein n=1 Tax=Oryza meyeriana var. granulata TaxID=110450 RepID=A0A6G1D2E1_9ORYZ|nr:hypothetical protein E2562_013252 [Oryza meyeriana var. granulata]